MQWQVLELAQSAEFDLAILDVNVNGNPTAPNSLSSAVIARQPARSFSRKRSAKALKVLWSSERTAYVSGGRTDNWLKIKTSKRQEAVIAGGPARGLRRAVAAPD